MFDFVHVSKTKVYQENDDFFQRDSTMDEVLIRKKEEGDVEYEFIIKWLDYDFDNESPFMKVEVFSDATRAFEEMNELFQELSDRHEQYLSPEEITSLLSDLGFKDSTKLP